jgi:hypothetical protein
LTGDQVVPGSEESFHFAARLVQDLPIRWSEGDTGIAESDVVERGWFRGVDECARTLAALTTLPVCHGGGFGGRWPLLRGAGRVIAPALPVAVEKGTAAGPDGEYCVDGDGVWRESVGVRELYLAADTSRPSPGKSFDLLWYGGAERFLVGGGMLEIEDLFGALRVPARPRLLDRILTRAHRTDHDLLSSLPPAAIEMPQAIEVRRPAELSTDHRWRDAPTFLAARPDIESVRLRGATIEARVIGGRDAIFALDETRTGWTLNLRAGDYAFTALRLERISTTLRLRAELDLRVDALAPGMRGRLVFDLRSDLVALG